MGSKNGRGRKPLHAETRHRHIGDGPGDWTIILRDGGRHEDVGASLYRTPENGYYLVRHGRVVFDAPPGTVSYACLRGSEPGRSKLVLPAALRDLEPRQVAALHDAVNEVLQSAGSALQLDILPHGSALAGAPVLPPAPGAADKKAAAR